MDNQQETKAQWIQNKPYMLVGSSETIRKAPLQDEDIVHNTYESIYLV